jgi:hypothetical protein
MDLVQVNSQQWGNWKEKYMAALFELDKGKLTERIAEAEAAVVQRVRELFPRAGVSTSHDQLRERRALENALYALHSLRSILEKRPGQDEKHLAS